MGDEPEPLLPGEDESAPRADDIEHWIKVYREMAEMCQLLLKQGTPEIPEPELEKRLRRFTRRLGFWLDVKARRGA
jgi:hypothetical protein